jgi:hypothetical protein|eukprot:COSAG01_NODE_1469_length_10206_cov_81.879786_7_plen_238_part_00
MAAPAPPVQQLPQLSDPWPCVRVSGGCGGVGGAGATLPVVGGEKSAAVARLQPSSRAPRTRSSATRAARPPRSRSGSTHTTTHTHAVLPAAVCPGRASLLPCFPRRPRPRDVVMGCVARLGRYVFNTGVVKGEVYNYPGHGARGFPLFRLSFCAILGLVTGVDLVTRVRATQLTEPRRGQRTRRRSRPHRSRERRAWSFLPRRAAVISSGSPTPLSGSSWRRSTSTTRTTLWWPCCR